MTEIEKRLIAALEETNRLLVVAIREAKELGNAQLALDLQARLDANTSLINEVEP